jgi:hypothetical protein
MKGQLSDAKLGQLDRSTRDCIQLIASEAVHDVCWTRQTV